MSIVRFRGILMDEVFKKIHEGDDELKNYFLAFIVELNKEALRMKKMICPACRKKISGWI